MPLKVSDGMGAWIKDFKKSDAPQFKGKSEKERRDQAIAAYLSAKRGDQKEGVDEAKQTHMFNNEKDARAKAKQIGGKYVRGTGKSAGKHAAIKEAAPKPLNRSDHTHTVHIDGEGKYRVKAKSMDHAKKVAFKQAGISKLHGHPTMEPKTRIYGESVNEETNFAVNIEGLPMMFMSAMGPGELKQKLRKIVKQPSMIQSVKRVTDADVKKTFRLKAQGRDEEEMDEGTSSLKPGWMLKADPKLGAAVKAKQDLAKKRQATYGKPEAGKSVKEEVNEISGELAQRYHDKAVKAPAPKDKKDPLKHTIKRFASMQKAQDIIHKSELKRIGGQK